MPSSMITGSATGVPRPAHLLQLSEGCMDYGDRRLDRSELAQQKIFKITLNLRARRRDQASLGFLFSGRLLTADFGVSRSDTGTPIARQRNAPSHRRTSDYCWFFCATGTLPVGPIAVTCKITSPSFAHA